LSATFSAFVCHLLCLCLPPSLPLSATFSAFVCHLLCLCLPPSLPLSATFCAFVCHLLCLPRCHLRCTCCRFPLLHLQETLACCCCCKEAAGVRLMEALKSKDPRPTVEQCSVKPEWVCTCRKVLLFSTKKKADATLEFISEVKVKNRVRRSVSGVCKLCKHQHSQTAPSVSTFRKLPAARRKLDVFCQLPRFLASSPPSYPSLHQLDVVIPTTPEYTLSPIHSLAGGVRGARHTTR
jgi:hypothetical protein